MTGKLQGIRSSPLVMPLPLLVSIFGIAFCSYYALGNSMDICITAGCEINEAVSLWGLSVWWFGTFAFCVFTILSLSGRPLLGVIASGLCVFIDIWLLILMLTTSTCISCLVVGGIFVLAFMAFRQANRRLDPLSHSILVTIWLVFFIANLGAAVQNSLGTWAITGEKNSKIDVYFSPSCTHCSTAIKALKDHKDAAFFPVMEKESDFDAIANMLSYMMAGDDILIALQKAQTPQVNTLSFFENAYLYFQLSRNKAKVLMSESPVVPLIEYKGLPAALANSQAKQLNSIETPATVDGNKEPMETLETMDPINFQNNNDTLPIDVGIAGSCGGVQEQPCDDNPIAN